MRLLPTMIMAISLSLAACASDRKSDTTSPSTLGSPIETPSSQDSGGVPCEQEIARVCADGMVDGCAGELTLVHVCIAADETAGPPCTQEIAKQCPEGQTDGCLQTPATSLHHICVLD
ncbi:MAG: hypothetical protein GY813_13050 [Halieaceae bacterium]|nr:hypothetical protein [Halieaceae bacterium]